MPIDPQTLSQVVTELTGDEADKPRAYRCSKGKLTVGIGRNFEDRWFTADELRMLLGNRGHLAALDSLSRQKLRAEIMTGILWLNPLSPVETRVLLENDIRQAEADLRAVLPRFDGFTQNRKAALLGMCFNLGSSRFRGFRLMLAAIRAGDWKLAAHEALDSKWAKEDVGESRSGRIARQLREG